MDISIEQLEMAVHCAKTACDCLLSAHSSEEGGFFVESKALHDMSISYLKLAALYAIGQAGYTEN